MAETPAPKPIKGPTSAILGPPNTMIGLEMPDVAVWSDRVVVALGQNPSLFTGPGTNTYLVGSGARRILLDPGQGMPDYLDVLQKAMDTTGCEALQEIVLTHGHPDHMGGVAAVMEHFGELRVSKLPWPGNDERYDYTLETIDEGSRITTEGATLRGLHTPGHAPDHLCFLLEEEDAIFSGDNVLGVGTTVIPNESGSLTDYMASLRRLLSEKPGRIYPAHGPCIEDGPGKIREYIAHREAREQQILTAMSDEPQSVPAIVARVYTDVPTVLHKAAELSVTSHLLKLEDESRVTRGPEHRVTRGPEHRATRGPEHRATRVAEGDPRKALWKLT